MKKKITWICFECAKKLGGDPSKSRALCSNVATYHSGFCDVCDRTKAVTEPRDYGLDNSYEISDITIA